MLSKIKISDTSNLGAASLASDVQIIDKTVFGKIAVVSVKYKHAQQLFDFGSFCGITPDTKDELKCVIEPVTESVKAEADELPKEKAKK